jgi:hypothetical protein
MSAGLQVEIARRVLGFEKLEKNPEPENLESMQESVFDHLAEAKGTENIEREKLETRTSEEAEKNLEEEEDDTGGSTLKVTPRPRIGPVFSLSTVARIRLESRK